MGWYKHRTFREQTHGIPTVADKGMTVEELEAIAARASSATGGPWRSFVEGRNHESGSNFIMIGEGASRGEDIELTGATVADQDFIAAARQDIPRLVDEVRRLKTALEGDHFV